MTTQSKIDLVHEELTGQVLSAFYLVYKELGYGFLESVDESALTIVIERAGIRVRRQEELLVWFQRQQVGKFRADLLVEDRVIVGLLLNFGPRAEFKRMAFDNSRKQIVSYPRSSAAESAGASNKA